MSYLLALTIGPVQKNIEESRKLKDLSNSSKIISELMKIARNIIANNKIIYPKIKEDNLENQEIKDSDIEIDSSNFMVAVIENKEELEELNDKIFNKFMEDKNLNIDIHQLKEIYFIFWAVEDYNGKDYKDVYLNLINNIKSIKNTYEFGFEVSGDNNNKCKLCGKRNIISTDIELCDFCAMKRNIQLESNYESTYEIALKCWKENNLNKLNELQNELKKIFKNEDKYYNKDLIERIIKESNDLEKRKSMEIEEDLNENIEIKKDGKFIVHIKEVYKLMKKLYTNEPNENKRVKEPHYRYIFMLIDIDNLGKHMSGSYNGEKKLKVIQEEITEILFDFSKSVKLAFRDKKLKGKIIYAGGDDLLLLAPIEELFKIYSFIENKYQKLVSKKYDNKVKLTYSLSLVITNARYNMSESINIARKGLKTVKDYYKDKDGIAINYLINNGKRIEHLTKKGQFEDFYKNLIDIQSLKDSISFSYIDFMDREFSKILSKEFSNCLDYAQSENLKSMLKQEFERSLKRSISIINNGQSEDVDIVEKSNLIKLFIEKHSKLFNNVLSSNNTNQLNNKHIDFENIINAYKLIKYLSKYDFSKNLDREEA